MTQTHLSDGSALQSSWDKALSEALTQFRQLSSSNSTRTWKPIASNAGTPSIGSPAVGLRSDYTFPARSSPNDPAVSDVVLHKKPSKKGEIFRAVLEVPLAERDRVWYDVDVFKGLLQTPETVTCWDNTVEGASVLEVLDVNTRINSTRYRLGWPASPRDAITISKSYCDGQNLVLVSTSLPRTPNEPAYLRPAPPYVRAHIGILAWHIQCLPTAQIDGDVTPGKSRETLRITCFWQWDPKGTWLVGASLPSQMPNMLVNLFKHARTPEARVPTLSGFGTGVDVGDMTFDPTRVLLSLKYVVVDEPDAVDNIAHGQFSRSIGSLEGAEALEDLKERRRLFRAVEFGLWPTQSWDVQIQVKGSTSSTPPEFASFVGRYRSISTGLPRLVLRFVHPKSISNGDLTRVNVSIERTSGAPSGIRINGVSASIEDMEPRSKAAIAMPIPISMHESGFSGLSMTAQSETGSILSAVDEILAAESSHPSRKLLAAALTGKARASRQRRSAAEEKAIASMIKRNYIYFTSLLQEPEAKWKPINDSRGVTLHQLRSIDPTLNVLRAEAVFVGIGIWDIYAVIANWGSNASWDTVYDEAILLEQLNEFTELWWVKGKAAWSTGARENVLLRTTYKTAESIHVVGMSVDDRNFFPNIPDGTEGATRLQIDLQGWSMESLSSNTVQVSLIEQRDPRSKSSLLQVVAAAGEQAIKSGAPPVVTALTGAKATCSRYEHDKATLRFEYEPSASYEAVRPALRTGVSTSTSLLSPGGDDRQSDISVDMSKGSRVECQFRCDYETWSSSIEVTVDPPPLQVSALRRHRVTGYGGLWFTVEHDRASLGSDKVLLLVKRGSQEGSKDRPVAFVNGSKIKLEVEEVPSAEVEALRRQKRGRPQRQPLDRPALPMLRRRPPTARDGSPEMPSLVQANGLNVQPATAPARNGGVSSFAYPFTAFYGLVSEATRAAVVPLTNNVGNLAACPKEAAFKALQQVIDMHEHRLGETGENLMWTDVGNKKDDGFVLEKKTVEGMSVTWYRTTGIMRGFSAREVLSIVQAGTAPPGSWDDRVQSETPLVTYGNGVDVRWRSCSASVLSMPIRGRGFMLATAVASSGMDTGATSPNELEGAGFNDRFFVASTSMFDNDGLPVDQRKYNPTGMTRGRILLEGWIMEDLDAYSPDTYDIPSSKCTYISAYDFAGVPASVNNTLNYNRHVPILSNVHRLLRSTGPRPFLSLPSAGYCLKQEKQKADVQPPHETPVVLLSHRSDGKSEARAVVLIKPGPEFAPLPTNVGITAGRDSANGASKLTNWRSQSKQSSETAGSRSSPRLTVAEVYVEARGPDSTFEIAVAGAWAEQHGAVSGPPEDGLLPPLEYPAVSSDEPRLPYVIEIIDTPRSLLRTAPAESEISGFTVRLLLEIPLSGAVDPLSPVKTVIKPFIPSWLSSLRSLGGVVGLTISRREATFGSGHRFIWRDADVTITQGNVAAGPTDWPVLDLTASKPTGNEGATKTVNRPIAIAQSLSSTSHPAASSATAEVATRDRATSPTPNVGTPDGPGTPPATPVASPRAHPVPTRSNSLYAFFTYPARTAAARGPSSLAVSTQPEFEKAKTNGECAEDANPLGASSTPNTTLPVTVVNQPAQSSNFGPHLPLAAFLLLGVVCFLLGSLFRSLVNHQEDFVVFLPHGADPGESGLPVDWREMRRIVQLPMWNWNVVLGVFRGDRR